MTACTPSGVEFADIEEDWAPQVPSIWDVVEDADDDVDGDDADALAPPFPVPGQAPDWLDPDAWIVAEHGAGRALAVAAEVTGRLDERLRRVPEAMRLAWCSGMSRRGIVRLMRLWVLSRGYRC